jgi:ComF family protein
VSRIESLRRAVAAFGTDLADAALDRRCPGCGGDVARGREICAACDAAVPRTGIALCLRCLRGEPSLPGPLRVCPRHGPERLLLSGPAFEAPLDRILHAFKYDGVSRLAPWIASLVPGPPDHHERPGPGYLLVPVPLHPARRARRGFDQTALLAAELSRRWGIPVSDVLVRSRDGEPQARLGGAQRRRNLEGTFRLSEPALVSGRAVLLLDDVATTGTTLLAAADALAPAGPAWILSLSSTHGGDPDPGSRAGEPEVATGLSDVLESRAWRHLTGVAPGRP